MKEEDYAFVTVDNDPETTGWSDAVVIDLDGEYDLAGVITVDEDLYGSDFITLADDTVMLSDTDMIDLTSMDLDMDGTTISFGV